MVPPPPSPGKTRPHETCIMDLTRIGVEMRERVSARETAEEELS